MERRAYLTPPVFFPPAQLELPRSLSLFLGLIPLIANLAGQVIISHWQGNLIVSRVLLESLHMIIPQDPLVALIALIAGQARTAIQGILLPVAQKKMSALFYASQVFSTLTALQIAQRVHLALLILIGEELALLVLNVLQTCFPARVQPPALPVLLTRLALVDLELAAASVSGALRFQPHVMLAHWGHTATHQAQYLSALALNVMQAITGTQLELLLAHLARQAQLTHTLAQHLLKLVSPALLGLLLLLLRLYRVKYALVAFTPPLRAAHQTPAAFNAHFILLLCHLALPTYLNVSHLVLAAPQI